MKDRRIAIVGAGSIGLYYGAKLAATGHDVHFLMRGGFDEAKRAGIRVHEESGAFTISQPKVYRDPVDLGPCDLVIVALKATANGALAHLLPPLLHADTAVLTLQNGLGNEELLADLAGAERVMGGLCFVCLTRRSLAAVDHVDKEKLTIGEFQRAPLPRTRELVQAFQESGIPTDLVENLGQERWRKLVWNIPFNGLAVARGGIPVNQILADPKALAECRALIAETIAAANALGFSIESTYGEHQIKRTYPMGAYRPSTLVDWEAGSPLEIEPIWGEPLRQARAAGLDMPHLSALYERLISLEGSRH